MFNMEKAKTVARACGVTSVLITGKGEPCLSDFLSVRIAFKEFPIELQTNGKALLKDSELADGVLSSINVLAISIDDIEEIYKFKPLVEKAHRFGILVRYTINISDRFANLSFANMFYNCKDVGIDQLSLRRISVPKIICKTAEAAEACFWINRHSTNNPVVDKIFDEMKGFINASLEKGTGQLIMELPFDNAMVYDLQGISVTYFDNCIQEKNNTSDIRSLIYQEDGHLYTSWDSDASKLF
jgi:hypothetical protein